MFEQTAFDVTLAIVIIALGLTASVLWRRCRRLERHADRISRRRRQWLRERVKEGAANRSAQQRYLQPLQESLVPIFLTTPEGEIVAANRAMVELLGYESEADLKRRNAADLYANPLDRITQTRARLEAHGVLRNAEIKLKRKDDVRLDVLNTIRVLSFPDGTRLYEGVCTDVTAMRRAVEEKLALEEQLHLAQKLEAIGQLASGIAHEINTPIQFVGDNAYFLRDSFQKVGAALRRYRELVRADTAPSPAETAIEAAKVDKKVNLEALLPEVAQAFEESFEGITRVTEIVRAMKEFAHPGDGELAAVDLNQAILTTLVVARNEYKHIADVETDLGELPPVTCRKGEINKVFLNMVINATHAIEKKSAGRGLIVLKTRCDGEHAIVTIADNGCGIPPSVIGRIFDPFFTTKPVGKGTGQGLAIARSVVLGHGGRIDVASAPGNGATFTIRIPLGGEESKANVVAFPAKPTATFS
jgi:PAS domain S-box-containing protein